MMNNVMALLVLSCLAKGMIKAYYLAVLSMGKSVAQYRVYIWGVFPPLISYLP